MKFLTLEEKDGLLEETTKVFINTNQITSLKCSNDQGLLIRVAGVEIPYNVKCSISVGDMLIHDIIEFTNKDNDSNIVLNLNERNNTLYKEQIQGGKKKESIDKNSKCQMDSLFL